MSAFLSHAEDIIRNTAHEILMPGAKRVSELRITEKSANDFVTEIDEAMEVALAERLSALLPGSLVLGEEAAAKNRSIIDTLLKTAAPLWVVDPLDGTRSFIDQSGGYGPIVCLLENGEVKGAWIYDVVYGGPILSLETSAANAAPVRIRPLGIIGSKTRPSFEREVATPFYDLTKASPPSCVSYRQLLNGEVDFIVYKLTEPWDHLAGIAMLQKAGMACVQWNGEPAAFTSRNNGLILARTPELAQRLLREAIAPVTANEGLPYAA